MLASVEDEAWVAMMYVGEVGLRSAVVSFQGGGGGVARYSIGTWRAFFVCGRVCSSLVV